MHNNIIDYSTTKAILEIVEVGLFYKSFRRVDFSYTRTHGLI